MVRQGGLLFLCAMLWGSAQAHAQDAITAKVKPAGNLKTEYKISSDQAVVTTTIEKTNQYDQMINAPLFSSFKGALQGMAYINSVVQTPAQVSTESNKWWGYDLVKLKSNAFVVLNLSTPVTLLFSLDESYRKCIAGKTPDVSDERGMSSGDCKGESTVLIKGPIAVYGNYATSINVDDLLREKQEVEITLGKSWSGTDTVMTSKFNVKSVSFDSGLARFFRVLNIPVFTERENVGYAGGFLEKVTPLSSRQNLMLGISRIIRQANERMLNP